MLNAIYYPYTAIRDEAFLKHGLLYWDEIEYISPFNNFDALPRYPTETQKKLAKFVKPCVPTESEKTRAHEQIMKLIQGDLPQWLQVDRAAAQGEHQTYAMFRDKLLPKTWKELERRGVVQFKRHGGLDDYLSHTYLGLTLMAILARCCAGDFKHTITDQTGAYESFLKHLEFLGGTSGNSPLDPASQELFRNWIEILGIQRVQAQDVRRAQLVSISLDVIDAKTLSVSSLIRLRTDKSALAAKLRQNYATAVENYITQLSAVDLTETNVKALHDDFRKTMQKDLDRLREEMKLIAKKTLLSKEVAVAVLAPVAGAAVLASTGVGVHVGGVIAVGALGRLKTEYRIARDAVFAKENPMAFLYAAKARRLY